MKLRHSRCCNLRRSHLASLFVSSSFLFLSPSLQQPQQHIIQRGEGECCPSPPPLPPQRFHW